MRLNYNKIFDELYDINRSITGAGYRKSLKILSKYIKFKIIKFRSGEKVFDWKVPKEWVIKNAYIKNIKKNKIITSLKENNLSIVSYSAPKNQKSVFYKNINKIYSIKSLPKAVPYVTSYYKKDWGFCLSYEKLKKINKNDPHHFFINSKFINGSVDIGIKKIKGKTNKIFLISSYLCHPSMANNELSGPLTLIGLYEKLKKNK